MTPYRAPLTLVSLVEENLLYEHRHWDLNRCLRSARNYQEWVNAPTSTKSDVFCPKCAFNTLVLVSSVICTGKRIGMCRRVVCTESREHFHVRCSSCSHTLLMATADAVDTKQREFRSK